MFIYKEYVIKEDKQKWKWKDLTACINVAKPAHIPLVIAPWHNWHELIPNAN